MKEFKLIKGADVNQIDELTDGLVNTMGYSDPEVLYPEFDNVKADDGVVAEWFYDAFRSDKDSSEIYAIIQYTGQASMYDEVGQLLMGIALTEMKHYDKLSDFIGALGGDIKLPFNTKVVRYGETPIEALEMALQGEIDTIEAYTEILNRVTKAEEETDTIIIAAQLLNKLIADEKFHKNLLERKIREFKGVEDETAEK